MSDNQTRPEINKNGDAESNSVESLILHFISSLNDQTLAAKNELLSIWGITVLQHNALQVLYEKDVQEIGLPSREIGQGLHTRVPDVTRLLDRLADKGWVIRERDIENRRIVRTRLTKIGKELVASIANPIKDLQLELFKHLSQKEREDLLGLLAKANHISTPSSQD